MLTTDSLYHLALTLREQPSLREALVTALNALLRSAEYGRWLETEQFAEERFTLPYQWPGDPKHKHLLENLTLVREDELQVKVERHGDAICLTDGLWAPPRYRVFPFIDESERLMEYIRGAKEGEQPLFSWPTALVDPATGSGHHPLYMSHVESRIGLDISVRAQAYCVLNKYLNGQGEQRNFLIGTNDIRLGLPDVLVRGLFGRVLFVVNMPFAITPLLQSGGHVLPMSAEGGEMGADFTLAALRAIQQCASRIPAERARACILNYSVGRSSRGPWFIEEEARKLFGEAKVKYTVLLGEKMWRINGRKEQTNPMPIGSLSRKADCKYYVSDARREETRAGYQERERQLDRAGWKFLAYGIVDIDVL